MQTRGDDTRPRVPGWSWMMVPNSILVVDDNELNLVAMDAVLEPLKCEVVKARSGADALLLQLEREFAVVLLDVQMPDMDGFEVAALMRSRERTRHTPIIFVTGLAHEDEFISRGYALGAVDYISKPFNPDILRAKVASLVELQRRELRVREQAEELRQQREKERVRFEATFELAPIGIGYLNREGRWLRVNPRLCEMLGYEQSGLLEQDLYSLSPPEEGQSTQLLLRELHAGSRGAVSVERRLRHKLGHDVWVQFTASAVGQAFNEPGYTIAIVQEITDRKQIELLRDYLAREQRERQRQLADSVALRDRFIGILGHDLRTPLSTVMMAAAMLGRAELNPQMKQMVERTARSAALMERMISDLLDLTRAQVGGGIPIAPEPIDLAVLARRAVDDVRAAHAEAEIQLTSPENLILRADPVRLIQVLTNLLGNAIKYGTPGRPIEVELEERAERVTLRISNEGSPIPSELLPHLFDPFRRGDGHRDRGVGQGLGLGLFIVQQIIKAHGGEVSVTSGPRTTFSVKVPREGAPEATEAESGPGGVQPAAE